MPPGVTEVFGKILYRLYEWPSCRAVSEVLRFQDEFETVHGVFNDCVPVVSIIMSNPAPLGVRRFEDTGGAAQARGFVGPVIGTKECHRLIVSLYTSRAHWMELVLELDFSGGGVSVRKVKVYTDSIPGSISSPDEAWPGILYDENLRKIHLTNLLPAAMEELDEQMQDAACGKHADNDFQEQSEDEDFPGLQGIKQAKGNFCTWNSILL